MKRPGITIMEVLAASMVIVIALVGISSTVTMALKKSKSPAAVELAALLAAERLNYYRSQEDPFRAVGGTHYVDPTENGNLALNNNFNRNPTIFVREYLYGTTAGEMKGVGDTDLGMANQRRRTLNGQGLAGSFSLNQVPATRAGLDRVVPNINTNNTTYPITNFGVGKRQAPAARANATLTTTNAGAIPTDVKFVREVWVQTNHPSFGAGPAVGGTWYRVPPRADNLPPYTVAVTVRVFARDTKTITWSDNVAGGGANVRNADFSGPGYDPTKPLAVVVGYFGLRRNL